MGRRYGLLGPNGQGKTTLLKHIAAGAIPTPEKWDVLLVEQECKATDRSVVQEVLTANVQVTNLLAEEKAIQAEIEFQDEMRQEEVESKTDDKGVEVQKWSDDMWKEKYDRLDKINEELDAIDADSADARVRKILSGLGFSDAKMECAVKTFSGGWRMRVSLAKAL